MIKTKDELLAAGWTDEGEYGVSKQIPDTFRSDYKVMVNKDDVYVFNYHRMGSDSIWEVDETFSKFRTVISNFGEKWQHCIDDFENILSEAGYEAKKEGKNDREKN